MAKQTPDFVLKMRFFECGKNAPKGSSFKGVVSHSSVFGSDNSLFNYTARKNAIKDSLTEESYSGYTSRDNATANSVNEGKYFTMSSSGKLYTDEDREVFRHAASKCFVNDGDLLWEIVVSCKDYETLKEYGYTDQNDLSKVANVALNKALNKVGFEMNNVIWWEDYHTNKKNPHMHITFTEKIKRRERGKFTPHEKNTITREFMTIIGAQKRYQEMNHIDMRIMQSEVEKERKDIVKSAKELSFVTLEKIANLYSQLPTKGRLQYNSSMMIPFRTQLDEIVDDILKTDGIEEKYAAFVEHASQLDGSINDLSKQEVSHYLTTQDRRLRIQIANAVLQNAKSFRTSLVDWKEENGQSILKNELEKVMHDNTDDSLNDFFASIENGDINESYKLLKDIPDDSDKSQFIKSVFLCLYGKNDIERMNGRACLDKLFARNYQPAKHYVNFMNKSYGFEKKEHMSLKTKLSPALRNYALSAIYKQEHQIENEIDKFIREIENANSVNKEEL